MDNEKPTILLVDDNALLRQMAKFGLQADYDVVEAPNAEEALTIVKKYHQAISVIVSDLQMPKGIEGAYLLEAVSKINDNIRRVLMSGTFSTSNITDVEKEVREIALPHAVVSKNGNFLQNLLKAIRKTGLG